LVRQSLFGDPACDVERKGGHLPQRKYLQRTLHVRSAVLLPSVMALRDRDTLYSYERVVRENLPDRAISRATNRLPKPSQHSVPADQEKKKGLESRCGPGCDWRNFHSVLASVLHRADCTQVRQRTNQSDLF